MNDLPRRLGLLDSIAIVVGIVIGGGIFVVPNLVARSLPSANWILICWAFAGVISFIGALACAELGAALPATGGQYVFIRETYGRLAGFLYGWTMFLVARTAQVAWLGVAFTLYVGYFVPLSPWVAKALAVGVVCLFALVNYLGVKVGAAVQNAFTVAKLLGIVGIVGGAFLAHPAGVASTSPTNAPVTLSLFGVAMIACLMSYDGWVQMSFVAGEIQRPKRNILLALAIGVGICIAVYLTVNLAYLRVLSVAEIATSKHVGADAAERAMGPLGGTLVSLVILISIVGTLNGCFLTTPRIYFAQARDGLFFRQFGHIDARFNTPGFAIAAQAVWAIVLVLTGSYDTLVDYAMFATWLFYGLTVGAVMVLRAKQPDLPRPYRMWGYPVSPVVFLAVTAWFLGNTLVTRPTPAFAGLGLIALGVPVYFIWKPAKR